MQPPINLVHLKFFCDAVSCGSISESAKSNYVTQSTVSQAIAKLEQVLGVELIVHARQKFQVTDQGKILFEESRHVFKSVQDIHDKIHQHSAEIQGSLKFACINSIGMSFIAPIYKRMQESFPQVHLNIKLGNQAFIRNAMRQNEVEFAIVVADRSETYSRHLLKRGQFNLYQHKKAPHHEIERGILVDSNDGLYVSELKEYFADQKPLQVQVELAGWEVVARFTEKNLGVGFFPDYLIGDGRYPELKVCPIKIPSFDYEICAIFNKGEKPSRAAAAFIDIFAADEVL